MLNFNKVIAYLASLVREFDITGGAVRVSVLLISDSPVAAFNFNTYTNKVAMIAAINALKFIGGGTNTASALNYTRLTALSSANGDRPNVPDVVVLIVSGPSNDGPRTLTEAYNLRTAGLFPFPFSLPC